MSFLSCSLLALSTPENSSSDRLTLSLPALPARYQRVWRVQSGLFPQALTRHRYLHLKPRRGSDLVNFENSYTLVHTLYCSS